MLEPPLGGGWGSCRFSRRLGVCAALPRRLLAHCVQRADRRARRGAAEAEPRRAGLAARCLAALTARRGERGDAALPLLPVLERSVRRAQPRRGCQPLRNRKLYALSAGTPPRWAYSTREPLGNSPRRTMSIMPGVDLPSS